MHAVPNKALHFNIECCINSLNQSWSAIQIQLIKFDLGLKGSTACNRDGYMSSLVGQLSARHSVLGKNAPPLRKMCPSPAILSPVLTKFKMLMCIDHGSSHECSHHMS